MDRTAPPSAPQTHPTRHRWSACAGLDFSQGLLFDTTDTDEAVHRCGQLFSPHRLQVLGREQSLRARMEHLPFGPLALNRLTWQAPVKIDPGSLEGYYLLVLPLRGHVDYCVGRAMCRAGVSQGALVGGGERFHFTASAGYEQIILRIERSVLDACWAALTGAPADGAIRFASELPVHGPAWRTIEPVLRMVAERVHRGADAGPALPHLPLRLQDMLITSLLLNQPHSAMGSERPALRATPAHLKKAQRWLLDHLAEPVTLTGLAQALEVPARTLQAAFQSAEGKGPMQWLRERRLHAVRDALLHTREAAPRVADTALRLGFSHLGEFSQHYRHTFGETPRDTLRRRG